MDFGSRRLGPISAEIQVTKQLATDGVTIVPNFVDDFLFLALLLNGGDNCSLGSGGSSFEDLFYLLAFVDYLHWCSGSGGGRSGSGSGDGGGGGRHGGSFLWFVGSSVGCSVFVVQS